VAISDTRMLLPGNHSDISPAARDLLDASTVVTSYCTGSHWLKVSACFDSAKITHLDSLGPMAPESRKQVLRFLFSYLDILRSMASVSSEASNQLLIH
jgi:hypothetical protein